MAPVNRVCALISGAAVLLQHVTAVRIADGNDEPGIPVQMDPSHVDPMVDGSPEPYDDPGIQPQMSSGIQPPPVGANLQMSHEEDQYSGNTDGQPPPVGANLQMSHEEDQYTGNTDGAMGASAMGAMDEDEKFYDAEEGYDESPPLRPAELPPPDMPPPPQGRRSLKEILASKYAALPSARNVMSAAWQMVPDRGQVKSGVAKVVTPVATGVKTGAGFVGRGVVAAGSAAKSAAGKGIELATPVVKKAYEKTPDRYQVLNGVKAGASGAARLASAGAAAARGGVNRVRGKQAPPPVDEDHDDAIEMGGGNIEPPIDLGEPSTLQRRASANF